jgi:predicted esterase
MMAPGGWAHWIKITPKKDAVALAYDGVDWDALNDQWGAAGAASVGFLYGTIDLPTGGGWIIDAPGVGGLYIDGKRYIGNPYATGPPFYSPAPLEAGRHRILLRAGGMGPKQVTFRLLSQVEAVFVNMGDLTLPDLVADEALDAYGAAPVVNCTGRVLRDAVLRFGDGERILRSVVSLPPLEPEAILKIPFLVRTARPLAAGERCPQEISIQLEGETYAYPCSLRVRAPRETRRNTFLSREDGSVQMYGVLPPSADVADRAALILSLHGASVAADGQVAAYMPKDWAYVVAPTNTRPFGFDWQDWGRRNALETLDDALARFPIDPDRVLLAGHSMGGHGTWHVGVSTPGRFAAIAPSAGWGSFETYFPFTLRRDATLADPRLLSIWRRAMSPDNPYPFLGNLRGTPIFVLQGEKDDNVMPMHARMLAEDAREEGARVIYREVPKMGHWWDDPKTPGVDCIDLSEMMDFLKTQRRDPHPREVHIGTADLGTCDRSGWIVIDEAFHPFDSVQVDARLDEGSVADADRTIEITTSGARGFSISPAGLVSPGRIAIRIDGQALGTDWEEGKIHLRRNGEEGDDGGRWKVITRAAPPPRRRAPIKAAYFEPFVLVYGTRGPAAEVAAMRRVAVLDAQGWYQRADGYAPVFPDTSVTQEMIASRNLILYATPGSNAVLERIAPRLPIRVARDGIAVGDRRYLDGPLAARFAYPNPLAPDRLIEVVEGTGLDGFALAASSNPCYSGSGYPDFVVYGAEVRRAGWGGLRAAGFFDDEGRIRVEGGDAWLR